MPDVKSFHESVKKGDLAGIRSALAADPGLLDATNEAGQSAFLLAMYYRQRDTADYLLSLGPKLDIFNSCVAGDTRRVLAEIEANPSLLETHSTDGWTPLHLAAFFGWPELATALMDAGANVNARSTNAMKNTPLHAAAAGGQETAVGVLLKHGADVNAAQEGGWTALHSAAQSGDRAIVELLLAHGAQPNLRAANNQAPLDLALSNGRHEVAALLEQLGAKLQ
jgi:ankyrin repeat protein